MTFTFQKGYYKTTPYQYGHHVRKMKFLNWNYLDS